jgi:hypothetical protein
MQSARLARHSKAERRRNRQAEPGTVVEGPERSPVRGLKGRASKWRDSRADSGRKTRAALDVGALGFVVKEEADELLPALQAVRDGKRYLSRSVECDAENS